MILYIIALICLIWFIISSIYWYSKYNDAKRRLDYSYKENHTIHKIILDKSLTNDRKIAEIIWEFDNLPF